jgi:L-ascorbate metabolism protein UlaG (beta-lactamase superfamily)
MERVRTTAVPAGKVHMYWLYQAGFIFKTSQGTVIIIDPYLSDSVRRLYGGRRAVPPPIQAEDAKADAILITHWHEDHLDSDSIVPLAEASDATFIGPPSCTLRVTGRGIGRDRVQPLGRGESAEVNEVRITTTFARHDVAGMIAEDAVGYIIDFGAVRVYHSGDTEYDNRLLAVRDAKPDVAMICIPGTGGSMNAYEAALLAWELQAKTVVPMHYGLWVPEDYGAGATLDPEMFAATYRRLGGEGTVIIPRPDQVHVLSAE